MHSWLIALALASAQAPDDAQSIMNKVAANSDSAINSRRQYVYRQRLHSSLLQSNGKIVCKESREYTVTPQESTTERSLVSFSGECLQGNQMTPYSQPAIVKPGLKERAANEDPEKTGGTGSDRESIAAVMNDLAVDPNSRDGIPSMLFPLGSDEIRNYRFSLKGESTIKGRRAYRLTFEPAHHKGVCIDAGDEKSHLGLHVHINDDHPEPEQAACRPWKGEVWIDAEEYQPVRIDTQLAKGVPWGVRVFLGSDLRQTGFSLTYQRVAEGVWFPATYGTEFRVVLLWAYKRTITMSMEDTDFRKAGSQSTVTFEQPEPGAAQ